MIKILRPIKLKLNITTMGGNKKSGKKSADRYKKIEVPTEIECMSYYNKQKTTYFQTTDWCYEELCNEYCYK